MLGRFLTFGPSSLYIHEPEEEILLRKYKEEKGRLFDYGLFTQFVSDKSIRAFKIHILVCTILKIILLSRPLVKTICIKPIYLSDEVENVSKTLKNAQILYISRHPCGRSESILRQQWHDQNIDPSSTSTEYLEWLGQSWGTAIHSMQQIFNTHPEWHWILYENLTDNPVSEFEKLYEVLGLSWSEDVCNSIQHWTTGEDGGYYEYKRNSLTQAEKWRKALTEEQIESIRKGCAPFKTGLYETF